MKDKDSEDPSVTFGIVADLQYCDADPEMNRYFRNAPHKLNQVCKKINERKPDFVVNLGDTIDRDWESFDGILPHFKQFQSPVHHVLGNHDYEIEDQYKPKVQERFGTDKYFDFKLQQWRFIVLDGNEISTYANQPETSNYQLAKEWLAEKKINANFWNGGIGQQQLEWLEDRLISAAKMMENVFIFCHFPIYPKHRHNLLNDIEVIRVLKKYDNVKAWICGHNHDGNYGQLNDIHFINMKGIVDHEFELAFGIFRLFEGHIEIERYGIEISARLVI